jgi:PhnB protein
MLLETYLTFGGNCREAMEFYKECLGGELEFQTVGESPLSDKMPPQMKEYILHATLRKNGMVLMGSDMVPQTGLSIGNAVSMALTCTSEDELFTTYQKLIRDGGSADHPIEVSFWGALFGDLTDKYGNHWLLIYNRGL